MKDITKEKAIEALEEIAELMALAGDNEFKIRAFRGAASTLAKEVGSFSDLKAIALGQRKVPGVGEGIKAALMDLITHGEVSARAELLARIPEGVLALREIPGLGPKKARAIVDELGITTIGELEYACKENRLAGLKGFGVATQQKILASIERINRDAGKMLLPDAVAFAEEVAHAMPPSWGRRLVGEVARGAEVVTEIVYALWNVSEKSSDLFLKKFLSSHPGRRLRFVVLDDAYDNLPLIIQQQLVAAPALAAELDKRRKPLLCPNGGPWEETWLEYEWRARKPVADAYRRARHGHVRGVFHNHTVESDGVATLEEMVKAAQAAGYEYIGISEHSQSAFYANGLKVDRLERQRDEIRRLQKKCKIRIFHGIECDILQDGSLDYSDDVLDELDFVVASIHSRFKMDAQAMTTRLERALSHPKVSFWGHPTGRLLLGRDAYSFDWQKIFRAAQKSGVAFEINAHPQRLDLDWRLGADIEAHQIPVCINPDAHSVDGLQHTGWGELVAEKAMIPSHMILNLKSVDEVSEWLKKRSKHSA
jgi:DNA polymerase (family 10)